MRTIVIICGVFMLAALGFYGVKDQLQASMRKRICKIAKEELMQSVKDTCKQLMSRSKVRFKEKKARRLHLKNASRIT